MVKNILLYGNSLVPAKDVNKYGEQHIARRLTSIIGTEVTLEKRENKEIGTLYIAEESLRDFECRRQFEEIHKIQDDFDVLFGPAYKGIPLTVATSMAYYELYGKEIRYCSNRKEIKDHGDTGILLGTKLKDGDRVVMIEDVTSSGKSMEETVPIVRGQANVEIVGLIVSLNRNEKGKSDKTALKEISELYGFPTAAIVSMPEVIEVMKEENRLDDELLSRIDAYYEQYGAKE